MTWPNGLFHLLHRQGDGIVNSGSITCVWHAGVLFTALLTAPTLASGQQLVKSPSSPTPALEARLDATEQRLHSLEMARLPAVDSQEVLDLRHRLHAAEARLQALETDRYAPSRPVSLLQAEPEREKSNDEESDDELKELREKVETLEKTVEKQQSTWDTLVRSGTSNSTMKISGRIHMDSWSFPETSPGINAMETGDFADSPQNRVGFRRLRFGVGGDLSDYMFYKIEMEFAGGNNVEFRDAYLGFSDLAFFDEVRIGNQKRPYGLDQWNSSRYTVFLERPFVVEAINQDARRLGILSLGYSDDLRYNWQYGAFNRRNIQDEGFAINDNFQGEVVGRLATTAWYDEASDGRGYLHLGLSGVVGESDPNPAETEERYRTRPEARSSSRWIDTGPIAGAEHFEMMGLESVLNLGPLQVTSEYMNVWSHRDGDVLHFNGAYVYVAYFLTGEHMPWERKTGQLGRVKPFENFFLVDTCRDGVQGGWGAWQVAARYSYADFSDDDIFGGVGQSFTLGLNWYWNANANMQFNWVHGQIDDRLVTVGGADVLTFGSYDILGARLRIDF